MSALGNLTVSLTMDTLAFTKGIDKSSHEAQKFAQNMERNVNKALAEGKRAMIGAGVQLTALAASFVGAGSAVQAFTDKINAMDKLTDISQKLGVTVESLSALQYAAQLSGSSAEELEKGLTQLSKAAAAAAGGAGEQAEAFAALGVSVKGANGQIKPTEQLLSEVATKFSGLSDGADKTAIAMQLFGKSGADLVPFLNNGAEGIKTLTNEAKLFGVVVGTEAAEAAARFNDNMDRLKATGGGLAKSLASSVLPAVNQIAESMLAAVKSTGGFTDAINLMVNNAFNSKDPAARVRELTKELNDAIRAFKAYEGTNLRGTVFQNVAARNVVETEQQLKFAQDQLNRQIDEINRPPESAATRQRAENERFAKEEADRQLRIQLEASEAKKRLAAEEEEIRKRASASAKLLIAQMNEYADALQKEMKLEREAVLASLAYRADEVDKIDARRFASEQAIDQIQFETSLIGKTANEIATLTYQRELESVAALEERAAILRALPAREDEVAAIEKEIDARKRLAGARFQNATTQEAQRQTDAQRDAYKSLYDDLSRGLTDSIFRGFENGKSAIDGFKSAIKNAFKSFVVRLAIQPAFDAVGKELGINKTATGAGAATSGAGAAGAAGFSQAGAAIAALAIGYQLNRAISGGFQVGGAAGNIFKNAGVIGGIGNRLFGRKTVLGASGIEGSFGLDGFSGQTFQDVTKKGGMFRSSRSYTVRGAVQEELQAVLNDAVQSFAETARAAGVILGQDVAQSLASFSTSGRFAVGTQEQLQESLDGVANALIRQAIPAMEQFRKAGENLAETAARVTQAIALSNTASILLGQGSQFGINNANAASGLSGALGGNLGALESAIGSFLSPMEQAVNQLALFSKTIEELGLTTKVSSQTTREEFAALLKSADLTTTAGQRELASLVSVAPALDAIIRRREEEATALREINAQRLGQLSGLAANRDQFLSASAAVQSGGNVFFDQDKFRLPAFASGGDFGGGLALVGEQGPEIIASGPARIFNAQQTSQMLSTDERAASEVAQLRADLRASQTALASLQSRMVRLLERWDGNGLPETRNVA